MSIPSVQLQYEVRKKINRVNSDYSKSISVADVDGYLNESKDIVYEIFASAAELNTTIRNHLLQLEIKNFCVDIEKVNDRSVFIPYPEDFYRLLRQTAVCLKDNCGERELIVRIVQSDDLSESLVDPYWKPSWDYEETIGDEGSFNDKRGLFIYHNGDFEVKQLCMDYLKKLPDVATPSLTQHGSYVNAKGETVSIDKDLVIDSSYFWRKIVDVAELLFKKNTSEIQDWQAQLNNIVSLQKLYSNN